jgi:hypothetical protein
MREAIAAGPPAAAGFTFPPRRCGAAAYVEALGGRLEIIADFGDERLAFSELGAEAA